MPSPTAPPSAAPPPPSDALPAWRLLTRQAQTALAVVGLVSLLTIVADLTLAGSGGDVTALIAGRLGLVAASLAVLRLTFLPPAPKRLGMALALWQAMLILLQFATVTVWPPGLPADVAALVFLLAVYMLLPNPLAVAIGLGTVLTLGHLGLAWGLSPTGSPPEPAVLLAAAAANFIGILSIQRQQMQARVLSVLREEEERRRGAELMLAAERDGWERARAISRAERAAFLQCVPVPLLLLDADGTPTVHSRMAEDLLDGLSPEKVQTWFKALLTCPSGQCREAHFQTVDGAARILMASSRPVSIEGAPLLVVVLADVTKLRRLETEALTQEAARRAPAIGGAPPRQGRSLSVLLVEDDDVSRILARTLLEQDGHRVTEAVTGNEAVTCAAAGGFDVVLMDIRLPGLGGPAAARAIRALPDDAQRVPIVAMTASMAPAQLARYRASGMDLVLAKPVDRDSLRALLAEIVAPAACPLPGGAAPPSGPEDVSVPAVSGSAEAHLDHSVLDGHRAVLGESRIAVVIDRFLDAAPETVGAAVSAGSDGDMAALAKAAHKLGSGALTVGLRPLADLARRIEAQAEKGDEREARAGAERLHTLFRAGADELNAYRRRLAE
ncbi:response regulator [Rhodospirillum centenum]|uniref:Response regulator receiver domain protein n=1 Tax=Rhodospirillum centenum (strain ATCC 51521 / SW) TaxID=414684 RepID=B6ITF8_RHOCS|nr:response regulator [Rhodospirillum centenum]ACI99176.1 response regulator receiver domain protein [Rhodospirillum centenum SW]